MQAHCIVCLFFKTLITPIDCEVMKIKVIILDMIRIVCVKKATPSKNSKNGYNIANPGTLFAKMSYFEKVILNPFTLSNFRNENTIKNIPM